jgi:hypothetical protein
VKARGIGMTHLRKGRVIRAQHPPSASLRASAKTGQADTPGLWFPLLAKAASPFGKLRAGYGAPGIGFLALVF